MKTNAEIYAKEFSELISNGTLKKKNLPNHGEEYFGPLEELSLFQYKRYLGSLRCFLDLQNMKEMTYLGY